ncbi:MAG: S26 family signal peptidase [Patescibacteria group bacterium]|nr:S26 family signal peptidase [Patescibacteria group bacterium]
MFQRDISLTKKLPISFIKRLIFSVEVEGESAWPELIPEKTYLATGIKKPKVGDFIVFLNPENNKEILVKKIKSIEDNYYFVSGNVSWANSSKDFGLVPKELVLGKIISELWKKKL